MKKRIISLAFLGIGFISFSQVKPLNTVEKPKEKVTNSNSKSLSESNNHPSSRAKISRKVKPVLRKENYEVSPQKD